MSIYYKKEENNALKVGWTFWKFLFLYLIWHYSWPLSVELTSEAARERENPSTISWKLSIKKNRIKTCQLDEK
jgi:hypothetical protein